MRHLSIVICLLLLLLGTFQGTIYVGLNGSAYLYTNNKKNIICMKNLITVQACYM